MFAPGQAIESSLKQLAERRTDIFGVGEEAAQEAAIGMKMGEEERRLIDDKIQWDGHTSSAEATARMARANISLNDQVCHDGLSIYHKSKITLTNSNWQRCVHCSHLKT